MLVTLDGRKRRIGFDAAAGNILDSARKAGLPAPFACKAGVCATCRAKVVSGEVEMAARCGLTDEEVASGYVLTCQSVPKGQGVELDYDAWGVTPLCMVSTTHRASASGMNGPCGSYQVWVQLIIPKNSIVFPRAAARRDPRRSLLRPRR